MRNYVDKTAYECDSWKWSKAIIFVIYCSFSHEFVGVNILGVKTNETCFEFLIKFLFSRLFGYFDFLNASNVPQVHRLSRISTRK